MSDPIIATVASALVSKVAGTAVAALLRLVKAKFAGQDDARAALEAAIADPGEDNLDALRTELDRGAAEDPEFADRLRELAPQANVEISASGAGVVNQISGQVSGNVVQAQTIEGGISFGPK